MSFLTKILGASWQPKLAAILTAIGPAGLFFLMTRYGHMAESDATVISGMVFSVLVAAGLATAKQSGVSNAPNPLATAQPVVPVTVETQKPVMAKPAEVSQPASPEVKIIK